MGSTVALKRLNVDLSRAEDARTFSECASKLRGVLSVDVAGSNQVDFVLDTAKVTEAEIRKALTDLGFSLLSPGECRGC
jgi:copper chaperone CopZ